MASICDNHRLTESMGGGRYIGEKDNKKFRKKQEKRNHLRKEPRKKARRIRDPTWKDYTPYILQRRKN